MREYIALRSRAGIPEEASRKEVDGLRAAGTCGTPDQVAEALASYGKVGLGYAITYFPEVAYDTSGVDLFERTVMRELQG